MGTVTAFTAARTQAIEDQAIVGGAIVNGHLILTRNNNDELDAGPIITAGSEPFIGQFDTASRPVASTHPSKVIWDTDLEAFFKSNGLVWQPVSYDSGFAAHLIDTTAIHPAEGITVAPTGEMLDTDAQSALETLFNRTALNSIFPRKKQWIIIEEDFLGGTPPIGWVLNTSPGVVGQAGWIVPALASGVPDATGFLEDRFGLLSLNRNVLNEWTQIHLATNAFRPMAVGYPPAFRMEFNGRKATLNDGVHNASSVLGLHNGTGTVVNPSVGMYFFESGASPNWFACSVDPTVNGGAPFQTDLGVAVQAGTFQTFVIESDGGGQVSFSIDGVLLATHLVANGIPQVITSRFGPNFYQKKTLGTGTTRTFQLDWIVLALESMRP